jgi:hypothetical protein
VRVPPQRLNANPNPTIELNWTAAADGVVGRSIVLPSAVMWCDVMCGRWWMPRRTLTALMSLHVNIECGERIRFDVEELRVYYWLTDRRTSERANGSVHVHTDMPAP